MSQMVKMREPDEAVKSEGPVGLTRRLLGTVRKLGGNSLTYHFSRKFSPMRTTFPYLHLETGKSLSKYEVPEEHVEALGRCHDFILEFGRPIVLSSFMHLFEEAEPELASAIMGEVNELGIYDAYMVPVFGPYDIDGVISVGFQEKIRKTDDNLLRKLEEAATSYHNRMVTHFGDHKNDIALSERENEVLTWIARGKSSKEIATILEIKLSSVDTYTRRIFEKMGVNDRVTAAVNGVVGGLVKAL